MGFWAYGLQGQNAFPSSGGTSTPYGSQIEINNCQIIGSISLNTGVPVGQSYRVLLNTFSLGTQLMVEFTPEQRSYTALTPSPSHTVTGVGHSGRLFLRESGTGTEITLGSFYADTTLMYNTSADGSFPSFNIYYRNYQAVGGGNIPPGAAFPRGGSGAGTTNQIAMVSKSDGVYFYIVGFPSYYDVGGVEYHYNAPGWYMGKIGNLYLENPALFDANADAYVQDSQGSEFGPGGGIPGLPTSPDYPGDNVDFPSLPTGANALAFSKMNLFKPSASQLGNALDILYSDSTDSSLEQILEYCKKWWYKPDQYCISLMLSPVNATTTTSKNIKFGKYDSEVTAPVVSDQFQIIDMGSCNVPLKYGSYLDFNPFASVKIFLPFIGFRSLNISEVMGATLYCKYYVDMLTGAAVCMLKVAKVSSNNVVSYTYECNLNCQVPLTSNTYAAVLTSLISAGISAGVGNYGAAAANMANIGAALGNPELTQSGQLSANSGVLGVMYPYLILEFPVPSTPNNYSTLKGMPSDQYVSLGSVSGFTKVDYIHLDIPDATDEERAEIESMLKSGVIF